jgi:hypothetical protein
MLHGMLKMNMSRLVFRAASIKNGKPSISADSFSVVKLIRACLDSPEDNSPIFISGLSGLNRKAFELNFIAKS